MVEDIEYLQGIGMGEEAEAIRRKELQKKRVTDVLDLFRKIALLKKPQFRHKQGRIPCFMLYVPYEKLSVQVEISCS